jgi:hypothetical protein
MTSWKKGWVLVSSLVLLGPASARAEEPLSSESGHRLGAYFSAGLQLYSSEARTAGGIGGSVGIRDTLRDRFILQADLSYLAFMGNALSLRLGAGVQRSGVYTPAVLLTWSTLRGDRVTFLTPQHPTPVKGPATTLGLLLAPIRFTHRGTQVSLLEFGVGVGTELPGLGLSYHLNLLEVGASF